MATEIAAGMSYLHSVKPHSIAHGDLKLANILIGGDFNVKVAITSLILDLNIYMTIVLFANSF